MTDPAEIRAEGRRLAEAIGPEAYDRYIDYLYDNADVLLADPAPVGLSQAGYTDEAIGPNEARMIAMNERLVKERDALCEALRIAVEAPAGLCCPECGWMWGESRDEYNGCEQCDENAERLAAVRELVDLEGDDG